MNAALAQRQPGSAIKPLTYAAALYPGRARAVGETPLTAATIIPTRAPRSSPWRASPTSPTTTTAATTARSRPHTALANSYNILAVRTLDAIGVDAWLIEQAARLGIPWEQEARSWKLEAGSSKLETGEFRDGRGPASSF